LVLLLAIGLILVRQGIIPWFNSNQNNPSTIAQPFMETFQNNDRNWPQLNSNGLNAAIASNGYNLTISNSSNETYFPHPQVGTLPDNFTLTTQFKQTQGASSNLFGLAFREKDDGNGGNVTGYAFVINYDGTSQVLKYDPNTPGKYTILDGPINPPSGFHGGLNTLHTLQAIVQGSKFFFKIDGQQVSSTAPDHSVTDAAYTGGQLTLYVSGTSATFVVTLVQLTIPRTETGET